MARAYSYLRFSTPEQAKGDSLRRQTALAEEYAKRHDLTLDTELNLKDLGVSAFRGDNAAVGALGAFLKAIQDGLVPGGSYLLVEALDRISRQTARKAVRILEEIVEAGVTLVTLNDGKHYTAESLDGADFLLAILLLMRGHEESATKAKRLKAAWLAKRQRAAAGEIQTVKVPAWIQAEGSAAKNYRNAKLSVIPERARIVRRIFTEFLDGSGKAQIAVALNAERVPTWGEGNGRKGIHWHKSYVWKILSNPAVTGRFVPHVYTHDGPKASRRVPQEPIPDYYPRVVDDATFERGQRLMSARRATVRSAGVASIVAGLARCPKCGSTMTRVMKGSAGKGGSPKLVCTKAKAGAGCEYRGVPLPAVERALVAHAASFRKVPIAETMLAEEIAAADEELYRVAKQVEEIVDAIERGSSAALSQRLAEREAQAEGLRAELHRLKAHAAETESRVVALRAARLAEALERLNPVTVASANAAMRECLESVTVDYSEGVLRLLWRHGPTTEIRYGVGEEFKDLDQAAS
jgi:DNA invertase Pin-like site-specific DNA recombinase